MQEIKTDIEIAAPPAKVWAILADINNWQTWSPVINDSSGECVIGAKLSITMAGKEPDKNGPSYNPVIKELNGPHFFRWRAHMLASFLFTNDKIFKLKATENGTHITHIEVFKGWLVPLFCRQMEKGVRPMLTSMNKALKELAEQ